MKLASLATLLAATVTLGTLTLPVTAQSVVRKAAATPARPDTAPSVRPDAPAPRTDAQDAGQESAGRPAYVVSGFRSAQFGMNRERVTDAIRRDFQVEASALKSTDNPADGTMALVATVAKLDPAVGPATITYIFGKDRRTLVHVNVVWLLDGQATAAQRDALAVAGLKLADYFASHSWAGGRSVKNVPAGANSVVAFVAKDKSGAAVEVRLDGVAYTTMVDGQQKKSPAAAGPARLRIAYSLNPSKPDAARIAKGAF